MKLSRPTIIFAALVAVSLALGLAIFFNAELGLLRNYGGDVMVTVFLFSCLTTFTKRTSRIAIATLVITFSVEIAQLLPLVQQPTAATELVLGSTFDYIDLAVYAITVLVLTLLHRHIAKTTGST